MNVNIFTLCDTAQDYNGKLVIVGTFNCINARQFPTIHSGFALVARITFSNQEQGIHNLEYSIKKKDEDVYLMPSNQTTVSVPDGQDGDISFNLIVKSNNINISSSGIYIVKLKIDDHIIESELKVQLIPQ